MKVMIMIFEGRDKEAVPLYLVALGIALSCTGRSCICPHRGPNFLTESRLPLLYSFVRGYMSICFPEGLKCRHWHHISVI